MAHSSCEHCGSVVEVTATSCPSCGVPVARPQAEYEEDQRERRLAELLAQARQAQQDGDLALALRHARQALATHPDCSTTHALLGHLYEQSGNAAAARYHFQSALHVTPLQVTDESPAPATADARSARPAQGGWMVLVLVGCVLASGLAVLFSFLPEARRQQQGSVVEMPLARPPLTQDPQWTWLAPPAVQQTEVVTSQAQPSAEQPTPEQPASTTTNTAPDAAATPVRRAAADTPDELHVLGPSARARMPARSAIPLIRQADQAYWRGEYGRAALIFEDVLRQSDRPNPRLHHDLACCYQQMGNSPKAAEHLQLAIQGYQALLADDPRNTVVQEELKSCEAALDDLLGTREQAAAP